MDPIVFLMVAGAALAHACWNALVKVGGDPWVRLALVNAVCGLCAAALLPFVDPPEPASWPYLIGSVVVHHAYYVFLVLGYRVGDLSQIYPIARGVAPLLVAIGAFQFAGERLTIAGALAVATISVGILSLTFTGHRRKDGTKAIAFALATGTSIAGYTILDGLGGRVAGDVFGYILYFFVIDAVPFCTFVAVLRRRSLSAVIRTEWKAGTIAGGLSFAAYAVVIWALSLTPMTYVSALRETSVILAVLIGSRLLGEPFGGRRLVAAGLVAAGVALLQFSQPA